MTLGKGIARSIRILESLENAILIGLLMSMLILAVVQIGLRNLFDSGIIWGDSLLRVLVLWVGLFGAMVASRRGDHINIDLITRFVGPNTKRTISTLTCLATSAICSLLAYHSFRFVQIEYEDSLIAFAGVPNWVCELIMPLAFCVIALRYLALSFLAMAGQPPTDKINEP